MKVAFGILAAACAAFASPASAQVLTMASQTDPCAVSLFTTPVYFEWNRADLTKSNEQLLGTLARWANGDKCAIARVEVTGHTDSSEISDPELDDRRADAVAKALVAAGLPEAAMKKDAKGKIAPARQALDGARQWLNRRATVVIVYAATEAAMSAREKKQAEDDAKAAELIKMLSGPQACGTPAPAGYGCALLAYEDKRQNDPSVSKEDMLKPMARVVTGVTHENGETKVVVLHPTTRCPTPTRPGALLEILIDYRPAPGKEPILFPMKLYGAMGRGENEALGASDPRRIEPNLFKSGSCPLPQRPAPLPVPVTLIDSEWGEPADKVLAEFGLIGDFSDRCATPAGGPEHFVFAATDDGAVISRLAMEDRKKWPRGNLQTIYLRAKHAGKNAVTLRGTIGALNVEVEARIEKSAKGYRIESVKSIATGMLKVIEDNTAVGTDHVYPWVTKCE